MAMAMLPVLLLCLGGLGQAEAPLPLGVRAEWSLGTAWREATSTRERVCLNGLWRWQPGVEGIPKDGWGWFKVPGCWPGISDYMQKDCQTVFGHPKWASHEDLGKLTSAWYQREFTIPANWAGRQIALSASYVNSLATVYVDGRSSGSISFPSGRVDLTKFVSPGKKHILSIEVVALPLKAAMLSYSDTNAAKLMKATVQRRGLCGDLFLEGVPSKERIDEVRVRTSVRNWTFAVQVRTAGLKPTTKYILKTRILDHGKVVKSVKSVPMLGADDLVFTSPWRPIKLWDVNTPQNQYDLEVTLTDLAGKVLDVQPPKRFGFRELWIDGRDFVLNGTRIFWLCVPVDNAAISAKLASYSGAMETFRRLKDIGVNMVYTHNYDSNPGSYLAFDEILKAADDTGVLVALTQPHFGDYDWSTSDADAKNGYGRHAAFFVHVAGNHPSVVAYSTSHNATGYNEDTDPDEIDGIHADRDGWAQNNMTKALRAQAIIERLDPSRIVYHHSSGNLGTMHTMNFYLNFVPSQEMDDWYEHWATVGVKPAFMVEYGVPFSWDWSMYRGWYKGQRSFGNAQVPWEYTMAEWNAQFYGDTAYNVSESEKRNIRWEAQKFKSSEGWFRWDYPYPMGSTNPDFEMQQAVWADYTTDNWRAFRTWGVSGISPWETRGVFWRLKDGVNRGRVEVKTDWDHLQRPGYSPDYEEGRYEQRDTAYAESDWVPTAGGESLLANNGPLLAYIAGKPGAFTDKTHIFRQGERVEKQLVVINNSRATVGCVCSWWPVSVRTGASVVNGLEPIKFELPSGQIKKIPMSIVMDRGFQSIVSLVKFSTGLTQRDSFRLCVTDSIPRSDLRNVGVFDPKGETLRVLTRLGVGAKIVRSNLDIDGIDTLIVGKGALSLEGDGLDLDRVREGLKVLVFEQTSDVLEKRFGFRVEEYGLRKVFRRVSDHPALKGLGDDLLHDWRGASTLLPPRIATIKAQQYNGAPSVVRTGILQPRVWRAGNRGNVASVLIEKPACGDFLPILDGGYSLQYSPLMEYREGKGMVLFCQVDVSGRTEEEPAADRLVANLLTYAGGWRPRQERVLAYAGDMDGMKHLRDSGFDPVDGSLTPETSEVLVLGPGSEPAILAKARLLTQRMGSKGRILALGLDQSLGGGQLTKGEYIGAFVPPAGLDTPLAGIGPADLFNRDPRQIPLFEKGVAIHTTNDGSATEFQLVPWQFDRNILNTKRVFRHTSFVLSRLLGNLGVHAKTPLLKRFKSKVAPGEQRWLNGFYLDTPVLEDDPYRFFGW